MSFETVWSWVKGKVGYAFGAIFVFFAITGGLIGGWDDPWVYIDLALAGGYVWLFQFGPWKPRPNTQKVITFEQGEVDVLISREDLTKQGLEPLPTVGEVEHGPNCTYCKDWR